MSIYEFSQALSSRAVQTIIGRSQSILNTTATDLRPAELGKSKTSFTITPEDIKKVHAKLNPETGELTDEDIQARLKFATQVFNKRKESKSPVLVQKDAKGITRLVFNKVSYAGGIDKIVDSIFGKDIKVSESFQKGHIRSLVTASLAKETGVFNSTPSRSLNNEVLVVSQVLDGIVSHLEKLDKDSSNLPEIYGKIVAHSTKRYDRHTVELQIKEENMESGGIAGTITGPLREYIKQSVKGSYKESANALYKALQTTGAPEELLNMLMTTKGSPSFLRLLELRLLHALDPKNAAFKDNKTYSLKNVPAGKLSLFKPDSASIAKLKAEIAREISNLRSLKQKIVNTNTERRLRDNRGRFARIADLRILLEAGLAEQIRINMGTGDRSDVLNLRTGRFAETAKIENVVMGRDGAVDIFYSYMKSPYATFAPGGRQSSPATRDPNILINVSIREIATTLVSNRLRIGPV